MMIVADNGVLHEVHKCKVQYYMLDIRNWIAHNIGSNTVSFSSVVLSWRGLMARASAVTLCSDLGPGQQVSSLI